LNEKLFVIEVVSLFYYYYKVRMQMTALGDIQSSSEISYYDVSYLL